MISGGDLVLSAMRALRVNPLRSALTALGVIIGVASVVAMVALGRGAQERIQSSISSLGSNLLIVVPGASRGGGGVFFAPGSFNTLTRGDSDAIAREVGNVIAVAPTTRTGAQLVAGGANWNTRIEGVTPEYFDVRDWVIDKGRLFESREERQARKVVVIGKTVADQLFPSVDPIGQDVRIRGATYEVIGVLAPKGQSVTGADQDDIVIAPFTTVKRRVTGRTGRADTVAQISIKADSEQSLTQVEEDVKLLLRQRHRIQGEQDDFTVQNLSSIAEASQEATRTFTFLLAGISAVSLIVGGVGIMNIMLVSVTERTREIGLRKALGARRVDILRQFGLEAVSLSVAGGLVGLALGILGAWGITKLAKLPLVLGADTALTALFFSAAVGIIFGAYPAWRAGRLDPIEALRRE